MVYSGSTRNTSEESSFFFPTRAYQVTFEPVAEYYQSYHDSDFGGKLHVFIYIDDKTVYFVLYSSLIRCSVPDVTSLMNLFTPLFLSCFALCACVWVHMFMHASVYICARVWWRVYYFIQQLRKTKHNNLALALQYSSNHARRCNHRPTRRRRHRPDNKHRTLLHLRPLPPAMRYTISVPGHPNRVRLRHQRQAHRHFHQTHRQTSRHGRADYFGTGLGGHWTVAGERTPWYSISLTP